jgi:hypothetical protein
MLIVHDDETTERAFQAIIDGDAFLGLQVGENKTLNITMNELKLTGFNVTEDNCKVKKDEEGIMNRLNGIMVILVATINAFIDKLEPQLPELQTLNYDIKFDYQDKGFGIGLLVNKKE